MRFWKELNGEIKAIISDKIIINKNNDIDIVEYNTETGLSYSITLKGSKKFSANIDGLIINTIDEIQLVSGNILSNEKTAVLGYVVDPVEEANNSIDKTRNEVFYKVLENIIYIDIDDSDDNICININTCPNTFPILEMIMQIYNSR